MTSDGQRDGAGPAEVNPEAVVVEAADAEETTTAVGSAVDSAPAADEAAGGEENTRKAEESGGKVEAGADQKDQAASPHSMKAPHISTLYDKQEVMIRHFGVTPKQALRTQALLRLGVTEADVKIAERLLVSRSEGADNTPSKEEWLLGVTYAQMSFHKALQVLGISEAVVEEERSRRLGELGSGGWGGGSECFAGQEGEDTCGGFFSKKRRSSSQELGTTVPGEVAFAPTHARVLQLEEVCHSQMTRIQELESQLAALSATSSSPGS